MTTQILMPQTFRQSPCRVQNCQTSDIYDFKDIYYICFGLKIIHEEKNKDLNCFCNIYELKPGNYYLLL